MPGGRRRVYLSNAKRQQAYRERAHAARAIEKLTVAGANRRLALVLSEYHEQLADTMFRAGYISPEQKREQLEHLQSSYEHLYQEYRSLYQELIELRQRVHVLEEIIGSHIYWKARSEHGQ